MKKQWGRPPPPPIEVFFTTATASILTTTMCCASCMMDRIYFYILKTHRSELNQAGHDSKINLGRPMRIMRSSLLLTSRKHVVPFQ